MQAKKFFSTQYKPSDEDIIRSRYLTTGVEEYDFIISDTNMSIIDVGGIRSERVNWLYFMSSISAILFFTAIDEYDGKVFN